MSIEVETLKKKDIDSYIQLIDDVFGYKGNRETIEKLIKKHKVLVIKKEDEVVASVTLEERYEYIKEQKYYYINYLCVKKDCRRKGYASKLFEKIEELVKENNIKFIELTSGNQRRHAHYFYQEKQFKIKDTMVFVKFYD